MIVKHLPDIWFSIIAIPDQYYVNYAIKKIIWIGNNNRYGYEDNEENVEKARQYLHGYVKWNGCSNWAFDEDKICMLHFCERNELNQISQVMIACWDWTKELLPTWGK